MHIVLAVRESVAEQKNSVAEDGAHEVGRSQGGERLKGEVEADCLCLSLVFILRLH